jgi:transposase-like protein
MTCPFCAAEHPELISLFGSQLLLSQYRCHACGTYFEGVREVQLVEQEVEEVADVTPATDS